MSYGAPEWRPWVHDADASAPFLERRQTFPPNLPTFEFRKRDVVRTDIQA
jgi:hypothetical protein